MVCCASGRHPAAGVRSEIYLARRLFVPEPCGELQDLATECKQRLTNHLDRPMALENLTDSDGMRRAEYTRRRKFYDEKTINSKLREEHEKDGWIHVADLQFRRQNEKSKVAR